MHTLEHKGAERLRERRYETTPIAQRPLVKTLLANAGLARMFWILAPAQNGKWQDP